MTKMDQGDLCICAHTFEEHFGGDCSRVNCRCQQFVLIDFGPALFAALKNLLPYLPDRNEALNYAATNEGRASSFHVAALHARELIRRIQNP
jgi:hypothetical protein